MKKTLTATILAILVCVCTVFGFTACGKCEHTYDNACDTTCNKCDETREITHTPEEDDGDCTTEVRCSVCGTVTTEAEAAHAPDADDGDCTTAIRCLNCYKDAIAGNTGHTDTDGDWRCDNPHCYMPLPGKPEDGDPDIDDGIMNTFKELQAAVDKGGNVILETNIDIGSNFVTVPEGVSVNLDLAGYTLSGSTPYTINNNGTLTVSGGTVTSKNVAISNNGDLTVNGAMITGSQYAIYATGGIVKLGSNSTVSSDTDGASVYWISKDAFINLAEYTGESIKIESLSSGMPLSNITLPDGWRLYDTNDVNLITTVHGGTFVAKAEITDPGFINTYERLQGAVSVGGDVTLGATIELGQNCIQVPEGVTVNLDLAGYALTGSWTYAINNMGTLTVDGGTVSGSGSYAIFNTGTLTVNGGTITGKIYNNIDSTLTVNGGTFTSEDNVISNYGTLTVNGGTFTSEDTAIESHSALTVTGGAFSGNFYSPFMVDKGTVKLVGNDFTFSGKESGVCILWYTNSAYIDLSEYTGESIRIQAAEANMTLSNVTLPTGWKLYDTNDVELVATIAWNTFVAKAEIGG